MTHYSFWANMIFRPRKWLYENKEHEYNFFLGFCMFTFVLIVLAYVKCLTFPPPMGKFVVIFSYVITAIITVGVELLLSYSIAKIVAFHRTKWKQFAISFVPFILLFIIIDTIILFVPNSAFKQLCIIPLTYIWHGYIYYLIMTLKCNIGVKRTIIAVGVRITITILYFLIKLLL